jgi:ribosome-associated heat shock protein Hsp15
MQVTADYLRLDRWLWFTRFYKTRSAATAAVKGGHVDVNGERASPGHRTQAGDRVKLVRDQLTYNFEVTAIPARRGPAAEARACYEESPESISNRDKLVAQLKRDRMSMPRTPGRPDKHTRRKLRARGRDVAADD